MNNRVRRLYLVAAIAAATAMPACAWQRIPAAPSFTAASALPVTLGVELSSSPGSAYYGPIVVGLLAKMSVVEKMIYPYREDDAVDAVLGIAIDGTWKGSGFGAGLGIGVTFGLLSPFIGPSMTAKHDLQATLTDDHEAVASHSGRVDTKVTWGIAGDSNEVSAKADDLQARKIAVEIAEWLQTNRQTILEKLQ
jgi:hypothetical protein